MKRALAPILEHKFEFLAVVFVAMVIIYGIATVFDVIPREDTTTQPTSSINEDTKPEEDQRETFIPRTLLIDKLGKKLIVNNPDETRIAVLDEALLSGVVRYPTSAVLNENGTVLIFGHSSYLAVVKNQNFRAFNGINTLAWGDLIRVQSDDSEFVYRVDRVYQLKATADSIPIQWDTKKLVLVTCNSFGTKEDRHIVEASFIDEYPIAQ